MFPRGDKKYGYENKKFYIVNTAFCCVVIYLIYKIIWLALVGLVLFFCDLIYVRKQDYRIGLLEFTKTPVKTSVQIFLYATVICSIIYFSGNDYSRKLATSIMVTAFIAYVWLMVRYHANFTIEDKMIE